MIERDNTLSLSSQCGLLGISRSSYYYRPVPETEYNLKLMREIDELYLEDPSYGSRHIAAILKAKGYGANRKRVARLMRKMGIAAIYPKPRIRTTIAGHLKFPYLLRNKNICASNQVWGTDITYIPVQNGFIYLVAYLDLYSRYVLSWKLSNSLESVFCTEALEMALKKATPEIVNSDQGVQYTSHSYVNLLKINEIQISMSGKGRCWDNIFVERFWRTLKYEEVYLNEYECYEEAQQRIEGYIKKYNRKRPHSALKYATPEEAYLRGM